LKIALKDRPRTCPRCGGAFTKNGAPQLLILRCLKCNWEGEYEILPLCGACKYYIVQYYQDIQVYEDGSSLTVPVGEWCTFLNTATTWDDNCPNWVERKKE